jgi:hemoglobin
MPPLPESAVYEVIGEAGFARLVAAFYQRVQGDDILGPMYPPDDWEGAEQRLRWFLIFRFGGPPEYLMQRGHPALRMRHAPFEITPAARDRWVDLMNQALEEVALPEEAAQTLRHFFEGTATFLINRAG